MEIYPKAPITEAALDIRVRGPVEIDPDKVEKIRDPLYPELFRRPIRLELRFETDLKTNDSKAETTSSSSGYAFRSTDGLSVYQLREDGFTHNRLRPYQEWKLFKNEARRLWDNYRMIASPEAVDLIGLNYVNDIEVPLGTDFSEYLRTYIEVPREIPQGLNAFSMSYQVNIPDEAGFLNVSQGYGVPQREGYGVIRLNIQCFKPLNVSLVKDGDEAMWEAFEVLRLAKTSAFEACITDRVREMIR